MSAEKTSPTQSERDYIRSEIRQAGLRATGSRIAVMSVLRDAERPMSHSEVTAALSARTWDRSTLYRNLVDLAEAGLLRRTALGDHTWRFEVAHGHRHADHNAHFLCVDCGVIECLPEITFNAPLAGRYSRALTSGAIEVHIRGTCDECLPAA